MSRETDRERAGRSETVRECNLKICGLCGSLNLIANSRCINCGWTGYFERGRDAVHVAVEMATYRNGPLDLQDITDIHTYREYVPDFQTRVCAWFARIWRWLKG